MILKFYIIQVGDKTKGFAQQVNDPPNQIPPISQPPQDRRIRLTKAGILSLLILISLLLLLFSGQLVLILVQRNAGRPIAASTTPTPTVQSSKKVTPTPTQNLGTALHGWGR